MKKLSYLIILVLILGLALTGCLFSKVGQVPPTEQPELPQGVRASDPTYDMTTDGEFAVEEAEINSAIWKTLPVTDATGSGVFNAFFRVQAPGNETTERGYNTDGRPLQFDEMTSATFTHAALFADVPLVEYPEGSGDYYYEFQLDINESKNTPYISLDEFQVWTTSDPELLGYTETTSSFPIGTGTGQAQLIYDLDGDDETWIGMDYRWNTGSGKRDYKVLVPDDDFFGKENTYVVIFTRHGLQGGIWECEDGFEEWGVAIYPPTPGIDITKTGDELSKVGDEISYTITIANTGNIDLENITVVDSLLGDLSGSFADTLGVGVSESHDFPYTVQPGDPDPLLNTVTVHSDPVGALTTDVTDSASWEVNLFQPLVEILKTGDTTSKVGDDVTYTFTITNLSDADAPDLILDSIMDDVIGDLTLEATWPAALETLSYGESGSFDVIRTVEGTDPDPLVNIVTVHYHPEGFENDVWDEDSHSVDLVHPNTMVTIEPDVLETFPGGNVILTITEENTGDVALENVSVTVNDGTSDIAVLDKDTVGMTGDDSNGILDPSETWTWELTVTIYVDTTFTVTGYGEVVGLGNIITYPDYPDEQAEATVETGAATRTLGFWKTHLAFTTYIFDNYLGEIPPINLGWKQVDSMSELMGIFWANIAKNSDGSKRNAPCKAKVQASWQAMAAILNSSMPGGAPLPSGVTLDSIRDTLFSNSVGAIKALASLLDDYNMSGDDVALDPSLPPTGKADPNGARDIADIPFADCL